MLLAVDSQLLGSFLVFVASLAGVEAADGAFGGLEGLFVPEALKKAHRVALCAFASFRSLLARVVKRRWQLRLRTLAPSFPAGLFVGAYAGAARVHNPGFPRGVTVYAVHGHRREVRASRGITYGGFDHLNRRFYRIWGRLLQKMCDAVGAFPFLPGRPGVPQPAHWPPCP